MDKPVDKAAKSSKATKPSASPAAPAPNACVVTATR